LRLTSGAIFDAIHVATAEAEGAEIMLTYDEGDFHRLISPSLRVVAPVTPPG
jgi:predicted nucleic acid-binding protein